MRWTRKHTCLGMLAVAAAILAVAAMNPVDTTPDEFGEVGAGVSVNPSSAQPATDGAPAPATTRPVVTLGNLDPPPDPTPTVGPPPDDCVWISWADRPPTNTKPAVDHPARVTVSPWNAASTAPTVGAADPDRAAGVGPRSPSRWAPHHDRPIC